MCITAITNANVVLTNGILWDGAILVSDDGRIAEVKSARETVIPDDALIIDAKGAYVGPGFVDIHVHGGNGFSTCYEPVKAANYFLRYGTTSILGTPDYHMTSDVILKVISNIREGMKECKAIKGIYMEGPFTNPDYGSHSDTNPWRVEMTENIFKPMVDAGGKDIKVWTVAPEREGLKPFLEYARKINPEVKFAVGHSHATPMQIRSLGKHKPTILTHAMCATHRQPVYVGTRGYGPDEYAFNESDVYAELISDSGGIHVHPEMQRLLLHNKGVDHVVLITDSTIHNNPSPKNLKHISDLNFDPSGGLAGSKLTMNVACRNIMTHTNCGITQAFIMASTNPAKAIGMNDEIGSIEVGKIADLVFVDDKFNVQQVMLDGELCEFAEELR